MNGLLTGIALISLTALANGLFSIPLRYRRRYAVQNMWVLVFVGGYFVLPQAAVQFLVPSWPDAIRSAAPGSIALAVAYGAGWGVASMFFSHAIARVGVSLGFAVIMGLTMAIGSIIPLARKAGLPANVWALALTGIAVALVGVALGAWAGLLRERRKRGQTPATTTAPVSVPVSVSVSAGEKVPDPFSSMLAGLALCVVAGVLSACSNLGYDYAQPLARLVGPDVHPVLASLVPWLPLYWGGAGTVLLVSVVQLTRNRTWGLYRGPGAAHDLRLTLLMVFIISLTQIPYGMGATFMGVVRDGKEVNLGTSVGFAISMILSLAVASIAGVIAGEWRGAGRSATRTLQAALACLVVATALLSWAAWTRS